MHSGEVGTRADIMLDVHGGLFGFEKEFPGAANAEAVVRRFGGFADLDGVLVNDILVGFGVSLFIINVPTERLEERVKEFTAKLGFVVVRRAVGFELLLEAGNEFVDFRGALILIIAE